mmetsp:Transcript_41091/g.114214  ORF Transcript_41091/g.114214 Transcript_41091/m.114214 type:complete len:209 (+) Transcript_41091:675-1301(+)
MRREPLRADALACRGLRPEAGGLAARVPAAQEQVGRRGRGAVRHALRVRRLEREAGAGVLRALQPQHRHLGAGRPDGPSPGMAHGHGGQWAPLPLRGPRWQRGRQRCGVVRPEDAGLGDPGDGPAVQAERRGPRGQRAVVPLRRPWPRRPARAELRRAVRSKFGCLGGRVPNADAPKECHGRNGRGPHLHLRRPRQPWQPQPWRRPCT